MAIQVYILRCCDGSYYVGSTRKGVEARLWEHNNRVVDSYTSKRTPVELVYAEECERFIDGFARERQLKGWSRAKKEALIEGAPYELPALSRNRTEYPRKAEQCPRPSTSSG